MPQASSEAEALLGGDPLAAARLATTLLKVESNNFVERPWGGMRIREYKRLCPLPDQAAVTGSGLGEAFEISAWSGDPEARAHPSRLRLGDGSAVSLAELLDRHARMLLGPAFSTAYGNGFPLLPKTLDIRELLSVQGHPEGHTEAYVIIAAEPGATLRLGFQVDVDAATFRRELVEGRGQQQALLDCLAPHADQQTLQGIVAPWLAARRAPPRALREALEPMLAPGVRWVEADGIVARLKRLYWRVLDAMNAIPVHAGQVLYNANPARIAKARGRAPAAEVHALGNPEGREILMLEIRRPGPTFRAWDNVRFPIRSVDVDAAVEALNFAPTAPSEFIVEPHPVSGRAGTLRSVDVEFFTVEHLRPTAEAPVLVEGAAPHSLHAIAGEAAVHGAGGALLGTLARGESAIVPVGVGSYRLDALSPAAELIRVNLPAGT